MCIRYRGFESCARACARPLCAPFDSGSMASASAKTRARQKAVFAVSVKFDAYSKRAAIVSGASGFLEAYFACRRSKCAKCHAHSGEGGKVGPDLTGMAAHPKSELIVHILDPSRSVEGNFLQYTVATRDERRRDRTET